MVLSEYVRASDLFPQSGSWMTAFYASLISGVFVTISMAPFDLVATRFYNQGVSATGQGTLFAMMFDLKLNIKRSLLITICFVHLRNVVQIRV